MDGRRPDALALLGAVLAAVAGAPDASAVVEAVLDQVVAAFGASAASFHTQDPGGRLTVRCRRPADAPAHADDALVAARVGGQSVGALGIRLPGANEPTAEERALLEGVAQILGLAVRNDDLVRGLGDRVRELDRQARQLAALTRVARRVSGTLDEGDAHRIVVGEARALMQADTATLLVAEGDGRLLEAAAEGPPGPSPREADVARARAEPAPLRRGRQALIAMTTGPSSSGTASQALLVVDRSRGAPFGHQDLDRLAIFAEHAAGALATARLLAELRREQTERRTMAASIVSAQEDERRRVAEDLHDGPVQELVGVGLLLDALAADIAATSPDALGDVTRAAAAAREAVRALRRAIVDLHPMALDELGFGAAVRSLVERLEWRGVRVSLDLAAADGLTDTHRTVAFRIVQEAVANVIRHAEPSRLSVVARAEGERVVIEIQDDGRGFDPDDPRPGVSDGHLGLAAARERAALAGGVLSVSAAPGAGTLLRLVLPSSPDPQGGGVASGIRSSAAASRSASAKRSSTTT